MTGTILNAAAIIVSGVFAWFVKKPLPASTQNWLKVMLGVFTVFFGLRLTWLSLHGTFLQILKQLGIVLLAMMLGKLTGQLIRLQKGSNHLGQFARGLIERNAGKKSPRFSDGFNTCAVLFCVAPLSVLGALQDGLSNYVAPLAIKAVMDALATMAFVTTFGRSVILAALPVFAWQGTLALLAKAIAPMLAPDLVDGINATGGLLVFCVALIILELKKIALADYLPSLAYAPLLTWLMR